MATPTATYNSQVHYLADGANLLWDFSFAGGYISKDHVKAYSVSPDGTKAAIAVTEDSFITDTRLYLSPAIAAGYTVVIYRDTPKVTPLVDWQSRSVVDKYSLNLTAKQAIFAIAEGVDGLFEYDQSILELFGFKNLWQVSYAGASAVSAADSGKSHYKSDGSTITVPSGLAVGFLTTLVNDSDEYTTLTFADSAILQGSADTQEYSDWIIAPRSMAQLCQVTSGRWYISGRVTPE